MISYQVSLDCSGLGIYRVLVEVPIHKYFSGPQIVNKMCSLFWQLE